MRKANKELVKWLGNGAIPLTPERSAAKMRKKLPIGIENFEEFSSEDFIM